MRTRMLALAATLVTAFALAITPTIAAASPWAQGRPYSLASGSALGYYVWYDAAGVHVYTTGPGVTHAFTADLSTPGTFTQVSLERPEFDDQATDIGGHVLHVRFVTDNGIDGVNFQRAGSGELTLALAIDGHPIDPLRIYVGAGAGHPAASTFTLYHLP